MTFVQTVPEEAATGDVAEIYDLTRAGLAHVTNFARAFSLRPAVYRAWLELNGSIKANMDLRRYELATIAAARRLRSSYCALAHGSVLVADHAVGQDELEAIVTDHHAANLDAVDVAVMDLADKVAADATSVGEQDIERLRVLGLSDQDIFDVVSAAAARCFFSKLLDGLGVQADARYGDALDPALRDALTVGRPISVGQ
jgi:uncharacterized peroxidase-related enzyme